MEQNSRNISRKKFLRTCGSVVAGGGILGVSAALLHRNLTVPEQNRTFAENTLKAGDSGFVSPYKLVSSFSVPDQIESFELYEDKLVVAASNRILVYDWPGNLLNSFPVAGQVRDMAVDSGLIYLLFPTRIEVYSPGGQKVHSWEACSDQSDYCSFTVAPGSVFVTDAAHKNLCQYTAEGNFVRFIHSPNGFVIPSYTFGIACVDGIIHCSNSGRHQVEQYTLDGEYIGSFGQAGGAAGMFCGCCNPVHLSFTSTGEIITSEKGNPRISCYGSDGQFRSLLLDSKALGGGNTAYDVKVSEDKLFIAGKSLISTFQYDKVIAAATACSGCAVDCPLRKGVMI